MFSIKDTYPSPVSGSVVAAVPASPSDAMFQINENKKHRETQLRHQLPGRCRGSAQQRHRRFTGELHLLHR